MASRDGQMDDRGHPGAQGVSQIGLTGIAVSSCMGALHCAVRQEFLLAKGIFEDARTVRQWEVLLGTSRLDKETGVELKESHIGPL